MGRAPCCEKTGLKRGPWTPKEDQILITHINQHGNGNWRKLPKLAGLLRCGKSCRLRWVNYLRPDIKRGNFTKEEEDTIIALHQELGNKWSEVAARLPGRTDNEIKNIWNTHLKKKVDDQAHTKTEKNTRKKKSKTNKDTQENTNNKKTVSSTVLQELPNSPSNSGSENLSMNGAINDGSTNGCSNSLNNLMEVENVLYDSNIFSDDHQSKVVFTEENTDKLLQELLNSPSNTESENLSITMHGTIDGGASGYSYSLDTLLEAEDFFSDLNIFPCDNQSKVDHTEENTNNSVHSSTMLQEMPNSISNTESDNSSVTMNGAIDGGASDCSYSLNMLREVEDVLYDSDIFSGDHQSMVEDYGFGFDSTMQDDDLEFWYNICTRDVEFAELLTEF